MGDSRKRWISVAVVGIAAAAIAWWLGSTHAERATSVNLPGVETTPLGRTLDAAASKRIARPDSPPTSSTDTSGSAPPEDWNDEAVVRPTLGDVNLDEVRKAIPDNIYWKLFAPTKDPHVLEERDAERDRWNIEYGKVLSGTGSEEEIRAYYDYRAQVSGDSIEFASYLLDHYPENLSEQDLTLLHLAIRLQRARLEEIPRKVEDALARKQQQDAARAAWLADQATFEGSDTEQQ